MTLFEKILDWIWEIFFPKKGKEKEIEKNKPKYKYNKRFRVMSHYELSFYNFISEKLNDRYIVIPQANLASFLYWNINGGFKDRLAKQNIDRYSVDFLLCDKVNSEPKLVIELDDYTHDREDRIERDEKVNEIILIEAGIGFSRFYYKDNLSNEEKLNILNNLLILIEAKK